MDNISYLYLYLNQIRIIWGRKLARSSDDDSSNVLKLKDFLNRNKIKRIFLGHTPSYEGVERKYYYKNNLYHLYLIDTGINQFYYKGRPQFVEIIEESKQETKVNIVSLFQEEKQIEEIFF